MGIVRNLRQDVTLWPIEGTDGFGGFMFGEPVLRKGRWEDKAELFINQDAEEVLSKSIVYMMDDVESGDYLALGDFASEEVLVLDPGTLSGAFRIRNFSKVTDLSALQSLVKAWL